MDRAPAATSNKVNRRVGTPDKLRGARGACGGGQGAVLQEGVVLFPQSFEHPLLLGPAVPPRSDPAPRRRDAGGAGEGVARAAVGLEEHRFERVEDVVAVRGVVVVVELEHAVGITVRLDFRRGVVVVGAVVSDGADARGDAERHVSQRRVEVQRHDSGK